MSDDQRDLGELCARATRRIVAAERPILARHGLQMWPYVVLSRLDRAPASTQRDLAEAIGYDKTRLIAILDDLGERGLLDRTPDPQDRRAHRVTLTAAGSALLADVRGEIAAMEEELLAGMEPAERAALRRGLLRLAIGEG